MGAYGRHSYQRRGANRGRRHGARQDTCLPADSRAIKYNWIPWLGNGLVSSLLEPVVYGSSISFVTRKHQHSTGSHHPPLSINPQHSTKDFQPAGPQHSTKNLQPPSRINPQPPLSESDEE